MGVCYMMTMHIIMISDHLYIILNHQYIIFVNGNMPQNLLLCKYVCVLVPILSIYEKHALVLITCSYIVLDFNNDYTG